MAAAPSYAVLLVRPSGGQELLGSGHGRRTHRALFPHRRFLQVLFHVADRPCPEAVVAESEKELYLSFNVLADIPAWDGTTRWSEKRAKPRGQFDLSTALIPYGGNFSAYPLYVLGIGPESIIVVPFTQGRNMNQPTEASFSS